MRIIFGFFGVMMYFPSVADAQTVNLDPTSQTVGQGQNVSVDVNVDSVNNLFGVAFHLYFDPTLLRFNSATKGDLLAKDGNNYDLLTAINPAGRLIFGASRTIISGVSGSGRIATLNFISLAKDGRSNLTFASNFLQDPELNNIAASWQNAQVTISTPDTAAPSAPANLVAMPVSTGRIDLVWSASTDNVAVTGYKIFRNNLEVGSTSATSYQADGLSPATSYVFQVRAFDAAGNESADSSRVSASTLTPPDTTPPDVPAGLAVTSVTTERINLSWSASNDPVSGAETVSGLAGYRVYRDNAFIMSVNTAAYYNAGLAPGESHSYQVSAIDNAGNESARSVAVTATTSIPPDTVAPSIPDGLTVAAVSTSQINLSWNASTDDRAGILSYRIYRNSNYLTVVTATSYQNTGLTSATAYMYQVSAVDAAGNESIRSASVNATTQESPDITPPSVPASLTVSSVSINQINLSWSASTDPSIGSQQVSGVAGYRIYRDNIYMMTVSGTTYYNDGLAPVETHSYQVSAIDIAGNESGRTAAITATTLTPPDTNAPSIPTGLTATAVSASRISLSWNASTDNVAVTQYKIFQNNIEIGTSISTAYQVTGLVPATNYTFTVKAVDGAGNASADSNQATAATSAADDNQAPGIIIITPTQNPTYATSSAAIDLSGTAVDNVRVARVSWTNDRGGSGDAAGSSVWLIDDINLQPGNNILTVTAGDAVGNRSSDSLVVTYNPPDSSAPSAPNLSATVYSAWQINLSWTASSDVATGGAAASGLAGYRLYRNDALIATLTGRSYQNYGLTPSTEYSYRVTAFDRAGNESGSNIVIMTTRSATDNLAPTAPTSLRAYLANDRQVNLSWYRSADPLDASRQASGIAGYRIYRDNRRVGFSAGAAYSDIDLATSTNFRYIVSAVDNAGNESFSSNTVQISTQTGLEKIRPSGPRYLRTNIISQNKAKFDWPAATDNVGVTGYKVFKNGVQIASVTGTAFEETGLAPLTVYSYRVSAFDAAGNNSYQSSALNLRTQATPDTTAPTQPANFRNVYNSYYPWTVRLYWNGSTDDRPGLRYYIYRNNQLIAESRYSAFSENLKEPGYYIYQVSAVDWAGNESARTNTIVQPYARDDIAPTLPKNLRSVYNAYYPNQVRLYWDRSVDDRYGAIKYRVYKNGSVLTVTTGTSFAENLTVFGTNYYEVQAYDTAGNETGRSNQVSVTYAPDTAAPAVPAGLRAFQDARTTNLMRIYWNRSLDDRAGNIVYNVYRDGVKLGATRNTSYYDRLAARGTYVYAISAQDQANNESDKSAPVTMSY